MKVSLFWFRRDLRLTDNVGLSKALNSGLPILPIFIFDDQILHELEEDDARVNFIYDQLFEINQKLRDKKTGLRVFRGNPLEIWKELLNNYEIAQVFLNKDYEPYALKRDRQIEEFLAENGIQFKACKDQVIFEENEVVKDDGKPYSVFTPYKNRWLKTLRIEDLKEASLASDHFLPLQNDFPSRQQLGIKPSSIKVYPFDLAAIEGYVQQRDYPRMDTTHLSPHLRFGTIGIRELFNRIPEDASVFKSELIWREFFMQILYHYPKTVQHNFKSKYDGIEWRNNEEEFQAWCEGKTGYPLVDAGMRELNQTGYMHNRVRMVTASFLIKHLLIDWRWGEAYFAKKLLDFELSSNVGNWQWAAGTGCDSAPYFRIFNPVEQLKKYDKDLTYVRKWVEDFDELTYPQPIVEHKVARERCLLAYKSALAEAE